MAMAEANAQQDPVAVDSGHYSVEHEDNRVRVLRIRYGAREKSVMHYHPAAVAILVSDANVRFHVPDGGSQDIDGKAGQVIPIPAGPHLPENLADRPFEVVLVELKGAG